MITDSKNCIPYNYDAQRAIEVINPFRKWKWKRKYFESNRNLYP